MENNVNSIKIKISFEGEIRELIYPENITIKELIKQFVNLYLPNKIYLFYLKKNLIIAFPNFKSKNFSLSINSKRCILDNTLETYKQDISTNNPFLLIYDYKEDNDKISIFSNSNLEEEKCCYCGKLKNESNEPDKWFENIKPDEPIEPDKEIEPEIPIKPDEKKGKRIKEDIKYNEDIFRKSQDLDLSHKKISDLEPEIDIKFFRSGKINDLKKNWI